MCQTPPAAASPSPILLELHTTRSLIAFRCLSLHGEATFSGGSSLRPPVLLKKNRARLELTQSGQEVDQERHVRVRSTDGASRCRSSKCVRVMTRRGFSGGSDVCCGVWTVRLEQLERASARGTRFASLSRPLHRQGAKIVADKFIFVLLYCCDIKSSNSEIFMLLPICF